MDEPQPRVVEHPCPECRHGKAWWHMADTPPQASSAPSASIHGLRKSTANLHSMRSSPASTRVRISSRIAHALHGSVRDPRSPSRRVPRRARTDSFTCDAREGACRLCRVV